MITRRKLLKWFSLSSITTLTGTAWWFKKKQGHNPYYSGPISDHFDGRVFYNPNGVAPGKILDLLKWQFTEKKSKWPESFDSEYHGTVPTASVDGDALSVTLIGHATFLIQLNGLNLITDPVFSMRASPFSFAGPKRVNPPGVNFDNLPKIDAILLTHNHYDHLDIATLHKFSKRDNPVIITPLGNDVILKTALSDLKVQTGDWGDIVELANDTKIHFEPCHHWSARTTTDRRMALWSAFVIETAHKRIYHIGDTGFHAGINYKQAAVKHGKFDLVILPIGAYAPRWFMKGQHQNPSEAVEGFKLCKAKYALGHHWGTFQLTNEPIEEPKQGLAKALKKKDVQKDHFLAMSPGQKWDA